MALAGAMVALAIDIWDGDNTKTAGTVALAVGLLGLAGQRMTGRAVFNLLAVAGFLGFVLITAYRAARHQGWI